MDNSNYSSSLFSSRVDSLSLLGVLKSSIENLHVIRRGRSCTPSRLKIPLSSNHPAKEKVAALKKENLFKEEESESKSTSKKHYLSSQCITTANSRIESPVKKISENRSRIEKIKNDTFLERVAQKIQFDEEKTSKEASLQKKLNQDLMKQAQQDLRYLNKNQYFLESKVGSLNESLSKLRIAHIEEQNSMLSIIHKLDHLESIAEQEISKAKVTPVPLVIEKLSKLESNYRNLKTQHSGSRKSFTEEIKGVNHKINDLKECNEILKELVTCVQKEPVSEPKNMKNAETFIEKLKYEPEETIPLKKLDPNFILTELLQQKEELVKEKEKMEAEYKIIPQTSKSMLNKRRKQQLELELSMNYNKLMSVNSKIKKYLN